MSPPTSPAHTGGPTGQIVEQSPLPPGGGRTGRGGYTAPGRTILLVSAACLAVFVLLVVLVETHALRAFDLSVAVSVHAMDVPPFERASTVVATLLAFEASTVYAILASVLLWRAGAGRWSIAPFAFFGFTALEILLKLTLDQPGVPGELQRLAPYPFNVVTLDGSFPSGHAMRSAFLCVFAAVLLWPRTHLAPRMALLFPYPSGGRGHAAPDGSPSPVWVGRLRQGAALFLVLLAVPMGLTRVYMGYHWLSDVIAGLALGAGTALLVATPVPEHLARRRTRTDSRGDSR